MGYFHAQNYTSGILLNISTIVVHLINNVQTLHSSYSFQVKVEQLRNSQVLKTNTLTTTWVQGGVGTSRDQAFTLSQKMSFNIQTDSLRFSFQTVNPFTLQPFHVFVDYDDNIDYNFFTKDYGSNTVDTYNEVLTTTIPVAQYNKNKKSTKIGVTCLTGD
jgi:hypothetical protein|nr:MAG TPA: hypothetical protein [Caudoviricetes sp.]